MRICDRCGASDHDGKTIVKVYGYDLCEDCNVKVIDFVVDFVKRKEGLKK